MPKSQLPNWAIWELVVARWELPARCASGATVSEEREWAAPADRDHRPRGNRRLRGKDPTRAPSAWREFLIGHPAAGRCRRLADRLGRRRRAPPSCAAPCATENVSPRRE